METFELQKEWFLSDSAYERNYPKSSKPVRIYGLPKATSKILIFLVLGPLYLLWVILITHLPHTLGIYVEEFIRNRI